MDNTILAIQRVFEGFKKFSDLKKDSEIDPEDEEYDPELYYQQTILLRILVKLTESYDWKKISAEVQNQDNLKTMIQTLTALSSMCTVAKNKQLTENIFIECFERVKDCHNEFMNLFYCP